MGLKTYKAKRDFKRTPEPSGGRPPGTEQLLFVVQKHAASHLHYDFRMELDGVLKSWAVPKGPSLDPSVKRLAMHVEDHPLDYKDFEGTIPEGNYGAGTVMIWDEGRYFLDPALSRRENEERLKEDYQKGRMRFYLDGRKLKGKFSLVRMSGPGKEHQWLMIKKNDQFSSADIADEDRSVKSGRTFQEIKGGTVKKIIPADIIRRIDLSGAVKAPVPHEISPMLATLADKPFDRPDWLFEVKWDGYRSLAEISPGSARLYSRNNKTQNGTFPSVVEELKDFPFDAVLDGEIAVVDEEGRPGFQQLQNYLNTRRGRLMYFVFDVLYLDGYDLRKLPLSRRREILSQIIPESSRIRLSAGVPERGKDFYRAAKENGLEGVIAKNLNSSYQTGRRSKNWLKIKIVKQQEAVIGGFTQPRGSRKKLGALILGVYCDGRLIYVGHAGGGFTEESLEAVYQKLQPLMTGECPFPEKPRTNMPAAWVKPQIVCEVKFSEWTEGGNMRHPVFLGLREDKDPKDVKKEKPQPAEEMMKTSEKTMRQSAGTAVSTYGHLQKETKSRLTNLNKIFWPQEGYTKGDLIEYYLKVAKWILPYLKGRPQALHRFPDGAESQGFFQKDVDAQPPEWVKTVALESGSKEAPVNYLVCEDADTLLYLANLGCIEINVWNAKLPDLDHPDYLVIDLDPVDVEFSEVIEVAQAARKVLDEIGIKGFCKTSGSRGMHVYIPVAPAFSANEITDFARVICFGIEKEVPELTSMERSPKKRQRKVYLDFLQNRPAATMASAYSVRPRMQPTVSTPLSWEEVHSSLDPAEFTIETIPDRLSTIGDPWKDFFKTKNDIPKALHKLEEIFIKGGHET